MRPKFVFRKHGFRSGKYASLTIYHASGVEPFYEDNGGMYYQDEEEYAMGISGSISLGRLMPPGMNIPKALHSWGTPPFKLSKRIWRMRHHDRMEF